MFISWLTADFSIMGVHIQYWIPIFILVFVVFYIFSEMDLRRIGKYKRKFPMAYFNQTDGTPERIGKVIGDGLAIFVYVFVLILIFSHLA